MPAPELATVLKVDQRTPSRSDGDNALAVYRALSKLTAHQASIERLWTYLCHFDCPEYVATRWLRDRPQAKGEAVKRVQNHFFAKGNRGLIRDNGVARLWWLGRIAHDVAPSAPEDFLTILLHRQDTRSTLIERPSVSMSRDVLRAIYTVMKESWEGDRELLAREAFRRWMIALNRRGGVVLLDALDGDALARLLREEAQTALASG